MLENVFSVFSYQGNANHHSVESLSCLSQNVQHQENEAPVRMWGKENSLSTVGGNVNLCGLNGN